jgi:hypothetical protein
MGKAHYRSDFQTMRNSSRLFRLTATVALTALLWDAALPLAALSQPAPPPLPPMPAQGGGQPDLAPADLAPADLAQADQTQADPPERVGRIAGVTGAMSFRNQSDTQWSAASPNYPVSSGNAFWTEPSSTAGLEISDSRIAMAGATELDVATLDASGLQAVAAQGEIYLQLRDLAPNEAWSIQTPRGLVRLSGEGRYDIVVGTTEQPTLVTVIDGAAQIDGPGVSLQIAANQTATITGTDSLQGGPGFQGSIGPAQRDAFVTPRLDVERPPPSPAVPVPAQVVAMPGGSDLIGSGSWSEVPEYGQVWYPPVAATWVPYREGHWAYVAPWGWTWIDDAPWGFAPFHYGRWIAIGGRWAWTPGGIAVAGPPVYAPALVGFIGIGAGVALGAALAAGSIGWVPLGPREPFHPWYHASNAYLRRVNIGHVTNINNTVVINNYVNRGGATAIPGAAMVGSRPVQRAGRPLTPQEFAAARPIAGRQPIRPTAATAGVTPSVARQLNLTPGGALRPAPGPAVRPQAVGPNGFARPVFAPGAGRPVPGGVEPGRPVPGSVEPGRRVPGVVEPGRPVSGAVEPGRPVAGVVEPGRPALSTPGARPVPGGGEPGRPVSGAVEPGRLVPGGVEPGRPALSPPGARPQGIATPEPGRSFAVPPTSVRPGISRPEGGAGAPHVAGAPSLDAPQSRSAPLPSIQRSSPSAIGVPHSPPQAVAPAAPRFEPPHAATPAPHFEPPHAAAPAPRFEPPHAAAPAAHFEPQRAAAAAPHFEPPRAQAPHPEARPPAPQEHKKPGER